MGFDEALQITLDIISPLKSEMVPLVECTGRIAAAALISTTDSPSIDASLRDGYAVVSADLSDARTQRPVCLRLVEGVAAAGGSAVSGRLISGCAMRILTGAEIPAGADAVLAEEFTLLDGDSVIVKKNAEPGRNIMPRGTDVARGQCILEKGSIISPGRAGIIAASGFSEISVFRKPRVAVIATGDEVIAPGKPLSRGKLYASNMITLSAFCRKWGMETVLFTAKDHPDEIRDALEKALESADAVLTSGGAWTGDRDLVAKILQELGWKKAFHRIRMGPGKAVGFGMCGAVPVFILPGGPPSNFMGFLQIALPGLQTLGGHQRAGLPEVHAALTEDIRGRDRDWTQFIFGMVTSGEQGFIFQGLGRKTRLESMAEATAVVAIPEGVTRISRGTRVPVQLL